MQRHVLCGRRRRQRFHVLQRDLGGQRAWMRGGTPLLEERPPPFPHPLIGGRGARPLVRDAGGSGRWAAAALVSLAAPCRAPSAAKPLSAPTALLAGLLRPAGARNGRDPRVVPSRRGTLFHGRRAPPIPPRPHALTRWGGRPTVRARKGGARPASRGGGGCRCHAGRSPPLRLPPPVVCALRLYAPTGRAAAGVSSPPLGPATIPVEGGAPAPVAVAGVPLPSGNDGVPRPRGRGGGAAADDATSVRGRDRGGHTHP